ncbi:MAG: Phage tail assembly chaperone [Pseudomonadota bacterium]|jgi:hypothetical protein
MPSIRKGREQTYSFPVDVKCPNPRLPGQFITETFKAEFRALPTSESRELVAEADKARDQGRSGEAMDLDKNILREVVVGWEGLEEEFSADMLEEAMDNPFYLNGLMTAYRKSLSGEAVQRRAGKN